MEPHEEWRRQFSATSSEQVFENYIDLFWAACQIHGRDTTHAVPSAVDGASLLKYCEGGWQSDPTEISDIISWLVDFATPPVRNKRAPGYIAHMDVPPSDLSVFAGLIERSMNQDPVVKTSSPTGALIESQFIRWFSSLVYGDQAENSGVVTTGGSQANFQALLLHRNNAFRRCGMDVNNLGVWRAIQKSGHSGVAVIASGMTHESLLHAMRWAGLGSDALLSVDTDKYGCISIPHLEERLQQCKKDNILVLSVALNVCTTGCGSIDPLGPAIRLARQNDVTTHVDAAHGGMLLLSSKHAKKVSGIEEADTATLDPHKILGVNPPIGFLGVRSSDWLKLIGKETLPYFEQDADQGHSLYNMDNTRSLNVLPAWMMMKALGSTGYEKMIDHFMELSDHFRKLITATKKFEIFGDKKSNIICFRVQTKTQSSFTNSNDITIRIFSAIKKKREFAMSTFETSDDQIYLRVVFVNPATQVSDVDAFFDDLCSEVNMLAKETVPNERV